MSLSLSRIAFVFEAVKDDFLDIANDSYGLCVVTISVICIDFEFSHDNIAQSADYESRKRRR